MPDVLNGLAWGVVEGDALAVLSRWPDACVHCCATSPPYFAVRDYGVAGQLGLEQLHDCAGWATGSCCGACYVCRMTAVFSEVRRVLRPDGTLWLNCGDGYAHNGSCGGGSMFDRPTDGDVRESRKPRGRASDRAKQEQMALRVPPGLKPKDLLGVPWRLALSLQADGWYLRAECVWAKRNPMPESVRDRPTRAHEQVFLFAPGQWKSRVVKFADLPGKLFHFGDYLGLCHSVSAGPESPAGADHDWLTETCVRLATAIFNAAQRQNDFRLPPFYAEVWEKGFGRPGGDQICDLPVQHAPAAWAARFLTAQASTKEFLQQLHGLGVTLPDREHFLVGRTTPYKCSLPPGVFGDGEASITVHYPGQIGKIDFAHASIIRRCPVGCSYFYDGEAVKERQSAATLRRFREGQALRKIGRKQGAAPEDSGILANGSYRTPRGVLADGARALRSVWWLSSESFKGSHFATFPKKLVAPCIRAGTSERGVCPACGAPWVRQVSRRRAPTRPGADTKVGKFRDSPECDGLYRTKPNRDPQRHCSTTETTGWAPSCRCDAGGAVPALVLDPFCGAGTTLLVARRLGRRAVGIDLSPKYCDMARRRIEGDAPLFNRQEGTGHV